MIPVGTLVRTATRPLGRGQVVDGEVLARRRGWFGRERYLIEWGVTLTVHEHGDVGEYDVAKWRSRSRIYGPVRSGSSDERGQG